MVSCIIYLVYNYIIIFNFIFKIYSFFIFNISVINFTTKKKKYYSLKLMILILLEHRNEYLNFNFEKIIVIFHNIYKKMIEELFKFFFIYLDIYIKTENIRNNVFYYNIYY